MRILIFGILMILESFIPLFSLMTLQEIVPWGRTLEEYVRMFSLTQKDLTSKILGVGDGPASFNAEVTAMSGQVISIDPVYAFSAQQIEQRVQQTYPTIIDQIRLTADGYRWNQFKDADELGQYRLTAMKRFLSDYPTGKLQGRYLANQLPILPFADRSFDLSVCSHLLFLYSKHLSEQVQYDSIKELVRVSNEVRIFPLQTLEGEQSPYLDSIVKTLTDESIQVDRVPVAYEFQRGANEMLRIRFVG